MKLAFYYHIPIKFNEDNNLVIPSYLGVFIDSLADHVEQLYVVLHESKEGDLGLDYELKAKNITWINLGIKTPAWHRSVFHKKILRSALNQITGCDTMLVRSPSPLAPYFGRYLNSTGLVYMIVGDYSDSVLNMEDLSFRQNIIKYFLMYNTWLFEKCIEKTNVVVNSTLLFEKYKSKAKSIHQIRTTTLSNSDFFKRNNTCEGGKINLVYTGRIDPQKGLFELIEATSILKQNGYDVACNIVGWESSVQEPVKQSLLALANELGISDYIIFHGRKKVGAELNAMYRMGDIYIIPSYHEGFPRTIWEAMANSLPVIATTVGSIPSYLENNVNALLIEPKNTQAISDAVVRLIENCELRKNIISKGQKLAKENTLEYQTKKLIDTLKYVATN